MRAEKKYLVDEVGRYLKKSDYFFLANYERITVSETSELRLALSELEAEFHVVKNSAMRVAAREIELPIATDWIDGPTSIIFGGENPAGVAKAVGRFFGKTSKVEIKGGVVDSCPMNPAQISELAKLPPLEVLRGQLLALLNTPAQQLINMMEAVPRAVLYLFKAQTKQENE